MPKLGEDIAFEHLTMELYVKQPYDFQQLEVGVIRDLTDPESFELISTISNSDSSVNQVTVDFSSYSGTGRYIAFRNTYTEENGMRKSYNYLDDIVLSVNSVTPEPCAAITLPYSEDFEGYTENTTALTGVQPDCWELVHETCWELVHEYVAMTEEGKPQLYYRNDFAHSGDYSLAIRNRGIYAMPAIASEIPMNTLKMEMFMRQSQLYYRLQVGVLEDNGAFTLVQTLNNSSTSVEPVEVDFSTYSGSGHRIAFRNVLLEGYTQDGSYFYLDDISIQDGSYFYLDDISISRIPNKVAETETGNDGTASGEGTVADNQEVGTTLGVDGFTEALADFTVYPNPTNGVVNVQCTMYNVQVETAEIHVLDAYGKLVNVVRVQPNETVQIDLSRYARGVYFVKAVADGNVLGVKKVVRS